MQRVDNSLLHVYTDVTCFKAYRGDEWSSGSLYDSMVNSLNDELAADGIRVNADTYYTAGYHGPSVRSINIYHEVWLAKP